MALSCLLLYVPLAASADDIFLPENDFFPGWKRTEKLAVFIQSDLFNHIDGGADLFLEFGFERVWVQRYAKEAKAELVLEVYKMQSPESALGVYLMKCGRETPRPEIPARNSSEVAQFTILKGKYFILIDNFGGGESLVPAMESLAKSILKSIPDDRASSRLFDILPKKDRLAGSERLIRGPVAFQPFYTLGEGDILKLEGKIFGFLANFEENPGSFFTRFIIPYPDKNQAVSVYRNLQANLDPYLKTIKRKEASFAFEDYRGKFGMIALHGSNLDISLNLSVRPKI